MLNNFQYIDNKYWQIISIYLNLFNEINYIVFGYASCMQKYVSLKVNFRCTFYLASLRFIKKVMDERGHILLLNILQGWKIRAEIKNKEVEILFDLATIRPV